MGTVISARTIARRFRLEGAPFDILELRLDRTGARGQAPLRFCRRAAQAGVPVILTIRSLREGGRWSGTEAERALMYRKFLPHVWAVDVEVRSRILKPVAAAARRLGKVVIGSFHDFRRTPRVSDLRKIIAAGRRGGAHIVKIATRVDRPADAAVLFRLLGEEGRAPLCLVAMGDLGPRTRITLAGMGSCLAYGYVDRAAAPGQMSCRALRAKLALRRGSP